LCWLDDIEAKSLLDAKYSIKALTLFFGYFGFSYLSILSLAYFYAFFRGTYFAVSLSELDESSASFFCFAPFFSF
jgi:hypothetical protein